MKSRSTIYKQKKATSIAITILVILTLAIAVFTLFMMFTGTKNLERQVVAPAYVFESASSQEEQSAFYSKSILELAFLQTYYQFAQNFDPENEISKEQFEDTLFLYMREINDGVNVIGFKELSDINKKIGKGEFKISVDDAIENVEFSTTLDIKVEIPNDLGIEVSYKPDIKTSVSLVELKLNSFQEISEKINKCKLTESAEDDMKGCFNALTFFSTDAIKKGDKFSITLTSKKKFLINDDLRNIVIKFELWKR